jgi:hypothetical protein
MTGGGLLICEMSGCFPFIINPRNLANDQAAKVGCAGQQNPIPMNARPDDAASGK